MSRKTVMPARSSATSWFGEVVLPPLFVHRPTVAPVEVLHAQLAAGSLRKSGEHAIRASLEQHSLDHFAEWIGQLCAFGKLRLGVIQPDEGDGAVRFAGLSPKRPADGTAS